MCADEVLKKTIEKNGVRLQCIVAMEEMAELTQALSKALRGKRNAANIAEEIADVGIMLRQLEIIFGNEKEVAEAKISKIQRLKTRLIDWRSI